MSKKRWHFASGNKISLKSFLDKKINEKRTPPIPAHTHLLSPHSLYISREMAAKLFVVYSVCFSSTRLQDVVLDYFLCWPAKTILRVNKITQMCKNCFWELGLGSHSLSLESTVLLLRFLYVYLFINLYIFKCYNHQQQHLSSDQFNHQCVVCFVFALCAVHYVQSYGATQGTLWANWNEI